MHKPAALRAAEKYDGLTCRYNCSTSRHMPASGQVSSAQLPAACCPGRTSARTLFRSLSAESSTSAPAIQATDRLVQCQRQSECSHSWDSSVRLMKTK